MRISVEGIYRNGKVELTEHPDNLSEGTSVIVTFVESKEIDLASQGINALQAKALRDSLATFADDWNSPEMSIYDDYESAKTNS